ncbi:hypothetical protein IPJ91_03400 [bacterium]|nr:MAG: hypothetical protein IPJ91_03400 [bacterium]
MLNKEDTCISMPPDDAYKYPILFVKIDNMELPEFRVGIIGLETGLLLTASHKLQIKSLKI